MPTDYVLSMKQQGLSPLVHAVYYRHLDIVAYLIDKMGADVNEANKNKETALIRAIHAQSYQICKYLLE